MAQQGSYPLAGRVLAVTDNATGVVGGSTADITFAAMLDTGLGSASNLGLRNRICNGNFRLDNYNLSAAVTPTVSPAFFADRWRLAFVTASSLTAQAGQFGVPPAPSWYAGKLTVAVAQTPAALDSYAMYQSIEADSVTDYAFGTASAKSVSISFWVVASVAGTYPLTIANRQGTNSTRQYATTYAATTTPTRVTVTIPGDTAGVWSKLSTAGLVLSFGLGAGTSRQTATANAWQALTSAVPFEVAGATQFISQVAGSTLQITGVQVEFGAPTPFEVRSLGLEVAMCQRYIYTVPYIASAEIPGIAIADTVNTAVVTIPMPAGLRSTTNIVVTGAATAFALQGATLIACSAAPTALGVTTGAGCIRLTFTATGLLTVGAAYKPVWGATVGQIYVNSEPN
jgi:hypothetical protein